MAVANYGYKGQWFHLGGHFSHRISSATLLKNSRLDQTWSHQVCGRTSAATTALYDEDCFKKYNMFYNAPRSFKGPYPPYFMYDSSAQLDSMPMWLT